KREQMAIRADSPGKDAIIAVWHHGQDLFSGAAARKQRCRIRLDHAASVWQRQQPFPNEADRLANGFAVCAPVPELRVRALAPSSLSGQAPDTAVAGETRIVDASQRCVRVH